MAVEETGETGGSWPPAELTVRVVVRALPLVRTMYLDALVFAKRTAKRRSV
jgi:hypothetical protein